MSDLSVLGVLGLPGAGKTTAAEALSTQRDDVEMIMMSDVAGEVFDTVYENGLDGFPQRMQARIRNSNVSAEEVVPDEDTSQALADFADTVLGIYGSFFSERAVELARNMDVDNCVVDGIRSTADVNGFDSEANTFTLLYIHTPFSVRLNRLQARGRDAEADATPEYLVDRDEQELGWGVDNILLDTQPNMFYNTFESESAYRDAFVEYVSDNDLL